jgi:hypothetical protein
MAVVECIEPIRDLDAELEDFVGLERLPTAAMFERLALEKLHSDEGSAIVLTNVVNRANVGMVQRRGRASFALEPLDRLVVPRELFWQKGITPKQ